MKLTLAAYMQSNRPNWPELAKAAMSKKNVTVEIVEVSAATVSKEISVKCAAIGLYRDAPTSEGF